MRKFGTKNQLKFDDRRPPQCVAKIQIQLESLAEGLVRVGDLLKDGKGNNSGGYSLYKNDLYAHDMHSVATALRQRHDQFGFTLSILT